MNDLGELSKDEINLVTRFRNGDRIDRARIVMASHQPAEEPSESEMLNLRSFAAYLECSDFGRVRCVEIMEIFAAAPSIEDAEAKLAEIEAARPSADVIDIAAFRA